MMKRTLRTMVIVSISILWVSLIINLALTTLDLLNISGHLSDVEVMLGYMLGYILTKDAVSDVEEIIKNKKIKRIMEIIEENLE